LLVRGDNWRWIFYINVPVGIVAVLMALLFVGESRDESAPRSIDWSGLALLSGGLFAIMFGVTRANEAGWTSALILGCFALGAALLLAFVAVGGGTPRPPVGLPPVRHHPLPARRRTPLHFLPAA